MFSLFTVCLLVVLTTGNLIKFEPNSRKHSIMQCNVALQECCTLLFASFHCVLFSLPNVHESTRSSIHLSPDRAIPYQNQRNLQLQNFSADTSKDGFKTTRTHYQNSIQRTFLIKNVIGRRCFSVQTKSCFKGKGIASKFHFIQNHPYLLYM